MKTHIDLEVPGFNAGDRGHHGSVFKSAVNIAGPVRQFGKRKPRPVHHRLIFFVRSSEAGREGDRQMKKSTSSGRAGIAIAALGMLAIMSAVPATAAPNEPFLFSYTFNHRLALGGGHYTMNGPVLVVVRLNDGKTMWRQNLRARPHSVTPGGAVYVHTTIPQPCRTNNNGYARALDRTTGRWSPRIPVGVCVRID